MTDQPERKTGGESVDPKTLTITAIAALIAAIVTSTFWSKGALVGAALTPVIISLVREGLNRHASKVTRPAVRVAATPVRGVAALAGVGAQRSDEAARGSQPGYAEPAHGDQVYDREYGSNGAGASNGAPPAPLDDTRRYDPARGESAETADPYRSTTATAALGPGAETASGGPTVYGPRRFRLKLALVTAFVAFAIAAAALTLPELVFGGSVTGNGGGTTLFGGGEQAAQTDGSTAEDGSSGDVDGEVAPSDPEAESVAPEEDVAPAPEEPTEEPTEEPAPEEPAPEEPAPEEPVEPQAAEPAPTE